MKAKLLFLEAVAAGAAPVLFGIAGMVIFLVTGIDSLDDQPVDGMLSILAAFALALALFQYVRLSCSTITERPYRFDMWFWLAVPCAAVLVKGAFGGFFSLKQAMAVTLPICLATLHFIGLQLRSRRQVLRAPPFPQRHEP